MSFFSGTLFVTAAIFQEAASEVCSASDSACETQAQADKLIMSLMQREFSLTQDDISNGAHSDMNDNALNGKNGKDDISPSNSEELAQPQTPFNAMRCNGTQVETTLSLTYDDYDSMINELRHLYSKLPTTCDAQSCPQGDFAGCVVRLAAHDFMDYKSGIGGSDGCIALDDPDNKGLAECLYKGEYGISVADAYEKFCTHVSLADFLVIAGEALMIITRENVLKHAPLRSAVDFRTSFKYGRTTKRECANPIGILPNPENSCQDVRKVFGERMGLNWNLSAALMGAHTLGKAEVKNSGYDGAWVSLGTTNKFDNDYYISMLMKGWSPQTKVGGNELKNQWQRVDIGVDETMKGKEMMLNTDLCLLHDPTTAFEVNEGIPPSSLNAATEADSESGCGCAWIPSKGALEVVSHNGGEYCGIEHFAELYDYSLNPPVDHSEPFVADYSLYNHPSTLNFTKERVFCCAVQPTINIRMVDLRAEAVDCGSPTDPQGFAHEAIKTFAMDEDAWLKQFSEAWHIATSNGHHSLKALDHKAINGRLNSQNGSR